MIVHDTFLPVARNPFELIFEAFPSWLGWNKFSEISFWGAGQFNADILLRGLSMSFYLRIKIVIL